MPTRAFRSAILLGAAALGGCAPDAVTRADDFDQWVRHVGEACQPARIGTSPVAERLYRDSLVLDLTSRFYHRTIGWDRYYASVNAVAPGDNEAALQCIRSRLPG